MNTVNTIKRALEQFTLINGLTVSAVIGMSKTGEGWLLTLEAVERRAIPDTMDVLGVYECDLDSDCNLLGFRRKRLRRRGETGGD